MVLHDSVIRKNSASLACLMSQDSMMLLLFIKLKEFISPGHASLVSQYHGSVFFLFLQLNVYYIFFSACLFWWIVFQANHRAERTRRISRQVKWHSYILIHFEKKVKGSLDYWKFCFTYDLPIWHNVLLAWIIGGS